MWGVIKIKVYLLTKQSFMDPPIYYLIDERSWAWINQEEKPVEFDEVVKTFFGETVVKSQKTVISVPEWMEDESEKELDCGTGAYEVLQCKANFCPAMSHKGKELYFHSVVEMERYNKEEGIEIVEEMQVDENY